jgi:hypothetical protein
MKASLRETIVITVLCVVVTIGVAYIWAYLVQTV